MIDNKNPCIVSLFMNNIEQKTVELQRKVVEKFNKSNIQFYHVLTEGSHGYSMNEVIRVVKEKGHDAILFLDIDCVPVNYTAIDYMFRRAYDGVLIGDAQRSNHIENGEHVFAGAHNVCFTIDLFERVGSPSLEPNHRGDVAEELTFRTKENMLKVELLMPLRYEAPPLRMAWEPKDSPPYWPLAKGMPVYGRGTTYGLTDDSGATQDMFWHCWQSFHPGQQERFWAKCEELLNG